MASVTLPNGGIKNNAGEFDEKVRTTQEAINATSISRALYDVGQRFYDTSRNAWFECVGSPAMAWTFKLADAGGSVFFNDTLPASFIREIYIKGNDIADFDSYHISRIEKDATGNTYRIYIEGKYDGAIFDLFRMHVNTPIGQMWLEQRDYTRDLQCFISVDWTAIDDVLDTVSEFLINPTAYDITNSPSINAASDKLDYDKYVQDGYLLGTTGKLSTSATLTTTDFNVIPSNRIISASTVRPSTVSICLYDTNGYFLETDILSENEAFNYQVLNSAAVLYKITSYIAINPFIEKNNAISWLDHVKNLGVALTDKRTTSEKPVQAQIPEFQPGYVFVEFDNIISSNTISNKIMYVNGWETITLPLIKSSGSPTIVFYDLNMVEIDRLTQNIEPHGTIREIPIPVGCYYVIFNYFIDTLISADLIRNLSYLENGYPTSVYPLGAIANNTVFVDGDGTESFIDLGGLTTTLDNVVMRFKNGSIVTNGKLDGDYSINADYSQQIFEAPYNPDWATTTEISPLSNLELLGNCSVEKFSVKWWGAAGNSPYMPDNVQEDLYGLGTDDTVPINWAIKQAYLLGGGKVFMPVGCYWVRCQVPPTYQDKLLRGKYDGGVLVESGQSVENGDDCAIYIFDNVTLSGVSKYETKVSLVNYMEAGDWINTTTDPLYKTKCLIGWAKREEWEFVDGYDKAYWDYYKYITLQYMKLGRQNAITKDFNIDCRVDVDNISPLDTSQSVEGVNRPSRIGAYFIHDVQNGYDQDKAVRSRGGMVTRMHFYNCNQATAYANRGVYKGLRDCQIYRNTAEKGWNKGIELFSGTNIIAEENIIWNFDVGMQMIVHNESCKLINNSVYDVREGINITTHGNNCEVRENYCISSDIGIHMRSDDGIASYEYEDNLKIKGNYFEVSGTPVVSADVAVFVVTGSYNAGDDIDRIKYYRNMLVEDNVFVGEKAYIGTSAAFLAPTEKSSVTVDGAIFRRNDWQVPDLQIIQTVDNSGLINRPPNVVKNIVFEDRINVGTTLTIVGDPDKIQINGIIDGDVVAESFNRDRLVFRNGEINGAVTVPSGKVYFLDEFVDAGSTIDTTGATIVTDRRL